MWEMQCNDGCEEQRPLTLTWKRTELIVEKSDVINTNYRVIVRKGDKKEEERRTHGMIRRSRGDSTSPWLELLCAAAMQCWLLDNRRDITTGRLGCSAVRMKPSPKTSS